MAGAFYLYDQIQPAGCRNWSADGRWVHIPANFRWWRDEEDRIAGWPAGHLAAIHGWTHGLRITSGARWTALRKVKSDGVADFFRESGHLITTPLNQLAGAEGRVFWDVTSGYNFVPIKVAVTDLAGRRVTFTCDNPALQVINLAFAHFLTRTRGFKRRFGRFDPTRVHLIYRAGDQWVKQPLAGWVDYRHAELTVAYAPRGANHGAYAPRHVQVDDVLEADNASVGSISDQETEPTTTTSRAATRSRSPRRLAPA